jgi:hypothetical protein
VALADGDIVICEVASADESAKKQESARQATALAVTFAFRIGIRMDVLVYK